MSWSLQFRLCSKLTLSDVEPRFYPPMCAHLHGCLNVPDIKYAYDARPELPYEVEQACLVTLLAPTTSVAAPEAAMQKDRFATRSENDVWPSGKNSPVESVAVPKPV